MRSGLRGPIPILFRGSASKVLPASLGRPNPTNQPTRLLADWFSALFQTRPDPTMSVPERLFRSEGWGMGV